MSAKKVLQPAVLRQRRRAAVRCVGLGDLDGRAETILRPRDGYQTSRSW